mmetsp:Transcript_70734/g.184191  ORF Transcript_70734/g.184191 Transcript_70734/m.184191 type:complete len:223 (+) Transcript_70734:1375-2043(+)
MAVVRSFVELVGDPLPDQRLGKASVLLAAKDEQWFVVLVILRKALDEAERARLLLDGTEVAASVPGDEADAAPGHHDHGHVVAALVVHPHGLANALHQQPLHVLFRVGALPLAATKEGDPSHILNDAVRGPGKLLARRAAPAQSIAVIVLHDVDSVRREAFVGTLLRGHGPREVTGLLHLDGRHDLQLRAPPRTLSAEDRQGVGVARVHMRRRSLRVHQKEK